MVAALAVVTTSQFIHIVNDYVVRVKPGQCYTSVMSQKHWEGKAKRYFFEKAKTSSETDQDK